MEEKSLTEEQMEDISLHILDIAENSIAAQAKTIQIRIQESRKKDLLSLEIDDDGQGMNQDTMKKALDPFFTTKNTRRFGFGLSLLSEAAKAAGGNFRIESNPGTGTKVKATFKASHIDILPLGDIPQTMISLIMGHPEIEMIYSHTTDKGKYELDTKDIKAQLNGLPINSPEVLRFIKKHIKEGITTIRRQKWTKRN
jgi:anti-sigma regulatory factor (Ser/Thr protein kinase)